MKEEVNAVKEKRVCVCVTSFPLCSEAGNSNMVWLLLAS